MANAKRCDRCQRFFYPFEMDGVCCKFRNPVFQTENDIREGVVGRLMMNDTVDAYVDLCPDCAEQFEAFMCGADLPEKDELRRRIDILIGQTNNIGKENEKMAAEIQRLQYENRWLRTENEMLCKEADSLKKLDSTEVQKDETDGYFEEPEHPAVKRRKKDEQKG